MLTTEAYGNDFVLDDLSFRRLTAGSVPALSIRKIGVGADIELSWLSVTNQLYQLQWAPGLETNQWFSLGSPIPGTGNTLSVTKSIPDQTKVFYRLLTVN